MATDPEELKRRNAHSAQPQLGMTLTPEQQRRQRIDGDMKLAASRINDTKLGLRSAASAVGDAVGGAYGAVAKAGTVVPRTLYGMATGEIPVTVSHLPDYTNHGLNQRRAKNWVANNPGQAEAAQQGMQGVADRAVRAGLRPPGGPLSLPQSAQAVAAPSTPSATDATGSNAIGGAPAGSNPAATPGQGLPNQPAQPSSVGQWGGTGIGVGAQGGEIVGRVNADGVAEFSNMAADQQAASGQPFSAEGLTPQSGRADMQAPAGSKLLASGSSATNEAEAFANRGSAANVGRGLRGYLSQGQGGDAQTALQRFEGANAERRKMLPGLTVAGNRGPMSMDELVQSRLGLRTRAQAAEEQRINQAGENAIADRGLRERELAGTEQRNAMEAQRYALEGQRTQQEIEAGAFTLEQQRNQAELLRQIQDPATPEDQRAALMERYRTLTTSGKDRYFLQDSVVSYDAMGTPIVGKQVIDTVTGQVVGTGNAPQAQPPQSHTKFEKGKAYRNAAGQRAEYLGGDVNDPNNWREI